MTHFYEPFARPRYVIEDTDQGEQIRIRPAHHLFFVVFIALWLAAWTAIFAHLTSDQPFAPLLVVGWAAGWIAMMASLVWMFTGSEILRVTGEDLEITHAMIGWTHRRTYKGSAIRRLSAYAPNHPWNYGRFDLPFFWRSPTGAVRFDYQGRTRYLAASLDEPEGHLIVRRLALDLPPTATAP